MGYVRFRAGEPLAIAGSLPDFIERSSHAQNIYVACRGPFGLRPGPGPEHQQPGKGKIPVRALPLRRGHRARGAPGPLQGP